jgi:energy-coupling factor transport system permease protein
VFQGLKFSAVSSPIHRLDPRVKFLFVSILFVATILFSDLLPLLILFFVQIPILIVAKVQREWLKTLRGALMLSVIIFVSNLLANYFYSDRILTTETLELSLAMTVRFITLITTFSIFFLTTSPDKLSLALEKARVPYELNFAFITAIRFVPVLADEAQTIMDAQKSRGLELEKGNFIQRIRNYLPILLPLIINSIRRSLELAEAMESRAFGAMKKRSNLYELKVTKSDYFVLVLSLIILFLVLYIRFFIQIPRYLFPFSRIL